MATKGQIDTNTTYESFFWVYWQENEQDIANNTTKIYWSCGVTCGHSFYSNAIKMSAVTINGTKVYKGGTYSNFSKGEHRIAYGYLDIPHNSDGSKTFSISSFTGWLYSSNNYSSNGGSFTLTRIPRRAELKGAPDFTDADNPSITYSNPAGDAVTALDACISLTKAKDDIAYRAISKTGTNYTFNLTDEERDLLRNNTAGNERTVYFFVRTKIGSNTYYWSEEKTFSVTENDETKPIVNMEIALNNSSLPEQMQSKFEGLYIQGKSRLDVTLSAHGKYGANITNLYAVIDGKSYNTAPFTSDIIQSSGSVVAYAKDSRGFTNSYSQPISVIAYSKPLVVPIGSENAILCYRSDENGVRVGNSTSVWIKAKRSYYSLSGKNQCALQWRRKLASEEWNDSIHLWSNLIEKTDVSINEYNALLSGEVFELKKSYTIQIRAIDDVGDRDIKTLEIPTMDVALHLGKGGKNVSIGAYCDYSKERTFHSEWDVYFDKDVYIGSNKVADFIVEQGTQNGWNYRMWNSGICEVWGVFYHNATRDSVETVSGSTTGTVAKFEAKYDFPFTIAENCVNVETIRFGWELSRPLYVAKSLTSLTLTAYLNALPPVGETHDFSFDIQIKGKWK